MHRTIAAVVVIVASGAVLVLELLSVRLVAPYVGVTHETYTAAIGIALAAIAIGAAKGGRAADQYEGRPLIGWLFIGAGALTLLAQPMATMLGPAFRGVGPAGAIVMVGLAIAVPAGLLSAIPPIVVKMQLAQLAETGTIVGWFSALGTAGGLIGTFVTGYVLLYALPVSVAMLSTGLLLVGVGTWQLLARQRTGEPMPAGTTKRGVQLGALTVIGLGAWVLVPDDCTVETPYFCARVIEDQDHSGGRMLVLDDLPHTYVDENDPTHLEFAYTRRFADAVNATFPRREGLKMLHIGGGGMTMPRWFDATRPGSRHTVLELDRHVVRLVEEEFGLPADQSLQVRTGDARVSIAEEEDGTYEVVIGDAFTSRDVPWHLATREFQLEVRRVLEPDGVYVLNVIDHPPFDLLGAQAATLQDVFGEVRLLADAPILSGEQGGNAVLVAGNDLPSRAELAERVGRDPEPAGVATRARLADLTADARVLTDDWAPVEQLLTVY